MLRKSLVVISRETANATCEDATAAPVLDLYRGRERDLTTHGIGLVATGTQ
jgi:hypothetical protein